MIHCVVFDFDGTLVLSNAIKRDAFYDVAVEYDGGRELMTAVLGETNGDRRAVLEQFALKVGVPHLVEAMIRRYTRMTEDRIAACPERPGARVALGRLRSAGVRLHVNSSTPAEALQRIISRRFPSDTFDGVHGGHGRKLDNLQRISRDEAADAHVMAVVGDGLDDLTAARRFGCRFVAVSGGDLPPSYRPQLDSLEDLPGCLD